MLLGHFAIAFLLWRLFPQVTRHNCAPEGLTRPWLRWGPEGGGWIVEERPARVRRRIRLLRDCYYTCSIGISTSICPDYRGVFHAINLPSFLGSNRKNSV